VAQAGRLDRRVVIEKPIGSTQTASGQTVLSFDHVDTVWAAIENVSGRERFVDDQVAAEVDTLFVMRWREDITPEYRIRADGRNYDVKRAVELRFWQGVALGRRQMLAVLATTRAE
jgi:SPP1 family predicted phage head-tail adaptor